MIPRNPAPLALSAATISNSAQSGVFEDIEALRGTQAFNVYGSDGRRLGRWEAVEGVTDEALLEAFRELLQRQASLARPFLVTR
jgi:hypothetical protein